jgi:polysaccharide pyruvyl transferase WcaK-like protein
LNQSFVARNPISKYIDNRVKKKMSKGIFDAINPLLFKNLYAHEFIENLKTTDFVVFNGGGLLADHLEHFVPSNLLEIYLAKKLGKRVFAVNYSVSVENPSLKEITFFVLKQVDYHLVREPFSKEYLIKNGIPETKIEVSPDCAFAADYKRNEKDGFKSGNEITGTGNVAILVRGDRKPDFKMWEHLANHLTQVLHKKVWFLYRCKPHDKWVFKKLAKSCEVSELDFDYDHIGLVEILKQMEFSLTDRYHGVVFSLVAGIPVIPFSATTYKTNGLCRLCKPNIRVWNPTTERTEEIIAWIDHVSENRATMASNSTDTAEMLLQQVQKKYSNLISHTQVAKID